MDIANQLFSLTLGVEPNKETVQRFAGLMNNAVLSLSDQQKALTSFADNLENQKFISNDRGSLTKAPNERALTKKEIEHIQAAPTPQAAKARKAKILRDPVVWQITEKQLKELKWKQRQLLQAQKKELERKKKERALRPPPKKLGQSKATLRRLAEKKRVGEERDRKEKEEAEEQRRLKQQQQQKQKDSAKGNGKVSFSPPAPTLSPSSPKTSPSQLKKTHQTKKSESANKEATEAGKKTPPPPPIEPDEPLGEKEEAVSETVEEPQAKPSSVPQGTKSTNSKPYTPSPSTTTKPAQQKKSPQSNGNNNTKPAPPKLPAKSPQQQSSPPKKTVGGGNGKPPVRK